MEPLNTLISRLKLDYLDERLNDLCEQAKKKDLNYREFLIEVLSTEWGRSPSKRTRQPSKAGKGCPGPKHLEQFDYSFQPTVDRKVVRELASLGFIERTENVVFARTSGSG